MTEETPALQPEPPAPPESPLASQPTPPLAADAPVATRPSGSSTGSGRGLPAWLPYFLLAVVPALVVGLVVYVFAGGGGGNGGADNTAGVLENFFSDSLSSHQGEFPPNFPSEFPVYKGAKIIASFAVDESGTGQGTTYIAVLTTSASAQDVYEYYSRSLDEDPWQVEVAQSGDQGDYVQFSRPDDAEVQGAVLIFHSDFGDVTSIRVYFQDLSLARLPEGERFSLGKSRPLPAGFPEEVPIYKGKASVVLATGFRRSPGSQVFFVSFLTKDAQDDIIDFYTRQFEDRGWTVSDSASGNTGFALAIDFADGPSQSVTGSIQADDFAEDDSYRRVDLFVQVSGSRGRGN